ncbi:MAG TPA: hypothetical protein VGP26_30595 [Actinophytocola sp.]|nr:hypothetical protein [Actinophytocola sp.]
MHELLLSSLVHRKQPNQLAEPGRALVVSRAFHGSEQAAYLDMLPDQQVDDFPASCAGRRTC